MDIKELDGNYQVSVKGSGVGVYSQKTVAVQHKIENGIITGTDEFGVQHTGVLTLIDNDFASFSINIDPLENTEVITTLANGLLTNEAQTIKGIYKIGRKDGKIMLTTMEERAGVTAIITCRKI